MKEMDEIMKPLFCPDYKQEIPIWVFQRFAIDCARRALPFFEEWNPEDVRPREALDAAERFLDNPSEQNKASLGIVSFDMVPWAWAAAKAVRATYVKARYYARSAAEDSRITIFNDDVKSYIPNNFESGEGLWQKNHLKNLMDVSINKKENRANNIQCMECKKCVDCKILHP